jgi:hypothetical protein
MLKYCYSAYYVELYWIYIYIERESFRFEYIICLTSCNKNLELLYFLLAKSTTTSWTLTPWLCCSARPLSATSRAGGTTRVLRPSFAWPKTQGVVSHLFAIPILVLSVGLESVAQDAGRSLSPICNPNFNFIGGVGKRGPRRRA